MVWPAGGEKDLSSASPFLKKAASDATPHNTMENWNSQPLPAEIHKKINPHSHF
jgi:hypothetical protein